MSLFEQPIQWHANIYDNGTQFGLGGKLPDHNTQIAVRLGPVEQVTPAMIINAAWKIEFAIRSQLARV